MSFNPAGLTTYNLSGSISSTATSITLSSFLLPVTLEEITMSLLNTDIVYATIAPKTTSSEFISFTGITQNANGTATLTGVTRGLNKTYPFTSDASFKLPHSGQSQFIISDAPQLFKKYGTLANDEVITGLWEGPNPSTAQGLVTNQYMLDLINGGAVTFNSVTEAATAGETISAGNLVYFSEVDNEWLKTDADTLATVFNVKLGIAQGSGTNGNPISGGVLTYGSYTTSGLTQGDLIYASNTAGGFNSGTAGTVPRVIGIAKDSTTLYFDPNFQNTLYNYAVDAVGTDAYAVTLPGALSVPYVGMQIVVKFGTANTAGATLAINGGSAKTIVKNVSDALATGDIVANQVNLLGYDGTNWVMLNFAGLASTTQKGVVEEATAVETNAGTQTGGTGADLFINPLNLPAKHLVGALGNPIVKTYFNIQIPFTLWTGSTSGAATTDFSNWTRTDGTKVVVPPMGSMVDFQSTAAASIYLDNFLYTGANTKLNYSTSTNIIVMDWWTKLAATNTGDVSIGFADSGASGSIQAVYNDTTVNRVIFAQKSTGELYATISKAGTGVTNTDISSGLTLTNWNNYRIELDIGNNALFYVNGALKATLSGANLPTTSNALLIGAGRSNTALFQATAPYISLEMNP